jgi:apolipoprotein N-acyltransferase
LNFWLYLAISLVAGLAQACAIATPWSGQPLWWLQILSLAALVALLHSAGTVRRAAGLGWVFACGWLVGCTWWLYISMHNYGGLAAPLAGAAVLALSAFLASYYAAACAAYFWIFKANVSVIQSFRAIYLGMVFAAVWTLAELARNSWFTGFPWGAGGYAHVDGPLAPWAAYVGVYGVGAAAAMLAACLAFGLAGLVGLLPDGRTRSGAMPLPSLVGRLLALGLCAAAVATAPLALETLWPIYSQSADNRSTGKTQVALLQGNIPQGEKFDNSKGVPFALEWYSAQLRASTATLTVAPETAIPVLPAQLPPEYWNAISDKFAIGKQGALIGVPMGSYEAGYTNSVLGLQPKAAPYLYAKHHLVPFGEFIPPLFKWFTQLMNIPLGDFNRGAVGQASFEFAGQRFAPNICYEDLFGDELAARFIDPASAPTVLVNMGNIGWFGNSIAIDQHLHISRMRALEFARPMLRATNTGPTVIIDHQGRVTASLPRHTRGALLGEVEGRTSITPFAWWAARFGLLPLWALCFAIFLMAAYDRRTLTLGRKTVN